MSAMDNHHFQVGACECVAMSDGVDAVPAEGIVKNVAPDEWRRVLVEHGDSPTEATTYFNCLYVQAGEYRVLVDAGWGKGTQRRDGALPDRLLDEGIAPPDIDIIVITHLDPDHVGGIATREGQFAFPNADYVLSEGAWDFWSNDALVAHMPERMALSGRKTLSLIQGRLEVVPAGVEFLPGLQLISAPGHRPGHTALSITSEGELLYHLADVVGHPILMEHPSWQWSFDARPDQAEKVKRLLLGQAAERRALVFGSHLPFPAVGHVVAQGEGWRWQPLTGEAG